MVEDICNIAGEQPDQAPYDVAAKVARHGNLPGAPRQLHHQGRCPRDRVRRRQRAVHLGPGNKFNTESQNKNFFKDFYITILFG